VNGKDHRLEKVPSAVRVRERFGWCLYDWANSAFATTILASILPVYFSEVIVPEGGAEVAFLGIRSTLSATSLWGYASGLSALFILMSAPFLGGIADATGRKKHFLMGFCYGGALMTVLLFLSGPGKVFYVLILFSLGHYCFVAANVFYDAFLPFLSTGKEMDRLSGQGFALGYLGGAVLLGLSLLLIEFSGLWGLPQETAVRISLASAGFWWAGFGTVSFFLFREKLPLRETPESLLVGAAKGLSRTLRTTRMLTHHRNVWLFLLAYMIYNDGVQTVIKMASIYGKDELDFSTGHLLGTLLLVQFVAIPGALMMSNLAGRFGAKRIVLGALLLWLAITLYAYQMSSEWEFWILGLAVGMVLGGTQALSRSLYASLIPREQSAQFFGYFSVFAKFSAIWGPIFFAFIRQLTGTARLSILSLSLFFMAGGILLIFVRPGRE